MEQMACECYGVVRDEFDSRYKTYPTKEHKLTLSDFINIALVRKHLAIPPPVQ
jgi:hypothetical protein